MSHFNILWYPCGAPRAPDVHLPAFPPLKRGRFIGSHSLTQLILAVNFVWAKIGYASKVQSLGGSKFGYVMQDGG
jgi:hypothetical protein